MRTAMANTLRESTAYRGGESHFDAAGLIPIPAMGFRPHLSTPVASICQGINNLTSPFCAAMTSCTASAVDTAFAVHTSTLKGATVSLIHGNMADMKLFAVSIYPGRTVQLSTTPTWKQMLEFALANLELLLKPKHALGVWFNDWKQVHVLDIVVCLADRDAALELGLLHHQSAIYDLSLRREIKVARPSEALKLESAGGGNV